MKKIIYSGPYEGLYEQSHFVEAMSKIEGLNFAGTYDIPSRNESGGLVGIGWTMGSRKEKTRVVYLARYSLRNSKLMSFLKGPKNFENVKIEIGARKETKLDGIEEIISKALCFE